MRRCYNWVCRYVRSGLLFVSLDARAVAAHVRCVEVRLPPELPASTWMWPVAHTSYLLGQHGAWCLGCCLLADTHSPTHRCWCPSVINFYARGST